MSFDKIFDPQKKREECGGRPHGTCGEEKDPDSDNRDNPLHRIYPKMLYIHTRGYAGGLDGRRSQRRIVNIKRVRSNAKS